MIEYLGWGERYIVVFKQIFEINDSGFEIENIANGVFRSWSTSGECVRPEQTYLLGISLFVIGSYPTHLTLAFSQDAQLGSL